MAKTNYKKNKKTGELEGSWASPASPTNPMQDLPQVLLDETQVSATRTVDYAEMHRILAEREAAYPEMSEKERAQEELREEVQTFARTVPEDPRALEQYFAMLSQDLRTTPEDVELRYETLKASFDTPDAPELPEWERARFVTRVLDEGEGPRARFVGTPMDVASTRAIAHLEDIAAEVRRTRRSEIETVDEDGTRWVKYSNERLSEVLRGVHYDEENKELKVWLAVKNSPDTVDYSYKNVHPSLVKQLVSARSMGRFYAYVFSPESPDASFEGATVNKYTFATHIANGLLPAGNFSTGRVPSRTALRKLKLFP